MDTQQISVFFTRTEKSLFGACSKLSQKLELNPLMIRIVLIVLTLIFIPLGIIVYASLYLMLSQNNHKMLIFGIVGALIGIPISYYFQSDIIKNYGGSSGVFGYLRNFPQTVERYEKFVGNGGDIIFNVFLSVVVCAILGGGLGYFITKKEIK
tara:strand:+ start:28586 stop:29044 length:459 start_codon:yes stop_codon:yes gene_type:complete